MTFDELARARAADDELRVLEMARRTAWDQATRTTRDISAELERGSAEVHRFDRLADLDAEILRRMELLNEQRARILRKVQALEDPTQRAILTEYFVTVRTPEGVKITWERVAGDLFMAPNTVYRHRAKAYAALGVSGPNRTQDAAPGAE